MTEGTRSLTFPADFVPTEFKFVGLRFLTIRWRNGDSNLPIHQQSWAICNGGSVLNSNNQWEYEPSPSNREDDFIARTRFPLDEAFRRAAEIMKTDPSLIREYEWYKAKGEEA